jgi:hypothetical protein
MAGLEGPRRSAGIDNNDTVTEASLQYSQVIVSAKE